jgi:hypothetical protein
VIRQIGVREDTCYRWRQEYGGLKTERVNRPKGSSTSSAGQFPLAQRPTLN